MFAAIGLFLFSVGLWVSYATHDDQLRAEFQSNTFKVFCYVLATGFLMMLLSACLWLWGVAP